jgi:hypothetical protein
MKTNEETLQTTDETKASPKNGAGKAVPTREPNKPIVLERVDMLELLLVGERQRRLQSEADRVNLELGMAQRESQEVAQKLSLKYGADLNGAHVAPDGTVTLPEK